MNMHSMKCPRCCHEIEYYVLEPQPVMRLEPELVVWLRKNPGSITGYYRCDQFGARISDIGIGIEPGKRTMDFWTVIFVGIAKVRVWEPPMDGTKISGISLKDTTLTDLTLDEDRVWLRKDRFEMCYYHRCDQTGRYLGGRRRSMESWREYFREGVEIRVWEKPLDVDSLNAALMTLRNKVRSGELDAGEASLEKWRLLIEFANKCGTWEQFKYADWASSCGLCVKYRIPGSCECSTCPMIKDYASEYKCYNSSSWKGMERASSDRRLSYWTAHARDFRRLIEACLREEERKEKKQEEPQPEWIYGVWAVKDNWCKHAFFVENGEKWLHATGTSKSPEDALRLGYDVIDKYPGMGTNPHKGRKLTVVPIFGVRELTAPEWERLGYHGVLSHYVGAFYNGELLCDCRLGGKALVDLAKRVVGQALSLLKPAVMLDDLEVWKKR